MRVLLSDGSGLTSRQVATRLAALGHTVGALAPNSLALTRFTRKVSTVHRVPAFGIDPFAWLDAAIGVYHAHRYEVLLPTQEQVAVLSLAHERLRLANVRTVVPGFVALRAVQDKVAAHDTLNRLGIPQPDAHVVHSVGALLDVDRFPVFVKMPIGTATSGVLRVADRGALVALGSTLEERELPAEGVLIQRQVSGPLAMVQTLFDHGRPLAFHANLRTGDGARGGACNKESVALPDVERFVQRLGEDLVWHGALSLDVVLTSAGPRVIDVNPRLVEPGNALRAGVDLVAPLLELALGQRPRCQPASREHARTHQLLLAVLGAAEQGRGRRGVASELATALRHTGRYANSVEELTPVRGDLRAALPALLASLATLLHPGTSSWFTGGSVTAYALSPDGWRRILAAAGEQ